MGKPVAPAFDQAAFRARTAVPDPAGVNTAYDGGDAALNANWTQAVDTIFRVRFLIQQTVAGATNHANMDTEFALQYNYDGGGWNPVAAQGADTDPVQYVNATGMADGDDTTQLLAAGTFVTGDGVEITPSDTVSFTEEALTETELEFALEIVSEQVENAKTLQLRVIYSDADESPPATVLDNYSNTPTVTVDEPLNIEVPVASLQITTYAPTVTIPALGYSIGTLATIALAEFPHFNGPLKDSSDHLYLVLEDETSVNRIRVFRSVDWGENWVAQDDSNRPAHNSQTVTTISVGARIEDNLIFISAWTNNEQLWFHTFNVSTEAWVTVDKSIYDPTNTGTERACAILVGDSSQDILISSSGEVVGTNEDSLYHYSTDGGTGTWSTANALDDENDTYDNLAQRVIYSPRDEYCYVMWNRDDTADYFVRWATDVDQAFSAAAGTDMGDFTHHANNYLSHIIAYDDGAQDVIVTSMLDTSDLARSTYLLNRGSPAASKQISSVAVWRGGSINHVSADELVVYRENVFYVFADTTNQHIYLAINRKNAASWQTEKKILANIEADLISATSHIKPSGEVVIGIAWEDTGLSELWYYEHVIGIEIEVPVASLTLTAYAPIVDIAAGAIDITVPVAALEITTYAPTVVDQTFINIEVPVASLQITTYIPTAVTTAHVDVEVPVAALQFTAYAPTAAVTTNVNVEVPVAALEITAYVPTVVDQTFINVEVPVASLTITTYAPTVVDQTFINIEVPVAALQITTYAPTVAVTAHVDVEVPVAALEITAYVPTVVDQTFINIEVPVAALEITAYVPTAVATTGVNIEVPVATLEITTYVPTVVDQTFINVEVPVAALQITTYVPTVVDQTFINVEVPVASLTITTYVPTVVDQTFINIEVPVASLTLTTYVPTVVDQTFIDVEVPVAALEFTTYVPTAAATANVNVEVPVASLQITTYAPTVVDQTFINIEVPVASLTFTAYAPGVAVDANIDVEVPVASLEITAYAPTADTTAHVDIEIPVAALQITTYVPIVVDQTFINVEVPVASLTITTYVPTVVDQTFINVEIPVASLELTTYAPEVIDQTFINVEIPVASLEITTYIPIIFASNHIDIEAPVAALEFTTYVPEAVAIGPVDVIPPTATLVLTSYAPLIAITWSELALMTFTLDQRLAELTFSQRESVYEFEVRESDQEFEIREGDYEFEIREVEIELGG